MTDLILHHFATSPFSEKVRIAFGIKQLTWKSVQIPSIMPKPDLMPLTGGYRRTPVLQIGADIYCDTQLIMLELEKRAPQPPLLPPGQAGEARAITMWVDRNIFWSAVGVVMGAIGDKLPEAFIKDRSDFSGRSFDAAQAQGRRALCGRADLCPDGRWPRTMLADGRPYPDGCGAYAWPTAPLQSGVVHQGAAGRRQGSAAARPAAADRRLVGAHEGASARVRRSR